jgi:quinoprotein glucose dehydrogenase
MTRRYLLILFVLQFVTIDSIAVPPSEPPAEFAQPQSPPKAAPFPVNYQDQGKFDPKLKGLLAPEGFQLELIADAPTIVNPVGMTFGADGVLVVLEWRPDPGREWYEFKETFRYRDGTTKAVATMKKFTPDVVKILRWNATSKLYDQAEVILTDELPSSVLLHDGWLYLSGRGTVRRYRQSQPNGKWDIRETIAQGFCGFHHHQVSGMTIGPDGWLYITSGDDDNYVEGSDGSRATVLRTGAVFRCRPDGSKMETYSLGYRNPYRDLAFDTKYNWFHADNDNEDGSRFTGCRLVHVAEDVDYGWRLLEGARCPDMVRGAVAGERPGKLQPMLKTGRGSPAGVLIYNDTQLPEQYRRLLYYPDVFRKSVRAYTIAQKGPTFGVTHEFEFLKSDDPLFRPCQMVTGPDGAIYICDWRTDSGGAGKLWGDGVNGRIYRMKWVGTKDQPAIPLRPFDSWKKHTSFAASFDKVAEGCLSVDQTTRQQSLIEMVRRGLQNPEPARQWFLEQLATTEDDRRKKNTTEVRLLCLYGLLQLWDTQCRDATLTALQDLDADVRRVAAECLGRNAVAADFAVTEALRKSLGDDATPVRRAATLALGRLAPEGAADAIVNAWKQSDGKDPFLTDAYLRALERIGKPGIDALLTLAQSGDDANLKKVADAFTALRSKAAANAIPDLLADPHLGVLQKAELIRSYTNYQFDPPLSLEPLVTFLTSRPIESTEIKLAGLDVLATTGSLGGGKGSEYVQSLIDDPAEPIRLAAYRAIETSRFSTTFPKLGVTLADQKRTVEERIAILKAGKVAGGADFPTAVVQRLASEQESAMLKVEALRTLSGIDGSTARKFAEKFLDQPDPALIHESIAVLGTTKAGAGLVAERYLAKKLPRDLFPKVSDILRKYPNDDAISKLNAEVLRGGLLLSLEPDQIENIRRQVASKGDAKRGRAVYLNTAVVACASCHKMEGVGGQVGPDLTRIWDTMTVEKLLETIIDPSKEIKEGYQTYKATTQGGQSYVGLKVTDTSTEVTIRESTGRDIKVLRKDLDELIAIKQSLMPDNVVSQLSYDQFLDLFAFLKNRKEQESLRGIVMGATAVVGISTDLKSLVPAETGLDPIKSIHSDGQTPVALSADPSAFLLLKPQLPAETTGVLLVSYVYSAKKQTANATLYADDSIRITSGGKAVFERVSAKTAPFTQDEKFTIDLQAGWNPIVIRLVTNGSTHRVGLHFFGDELRTSSRPEN